MLIINSEYPPLGGGAGNASANLARTLVEQGQQVAVMTVQFSGLPREEIQNGVLVRRIRALRKNMDRSGPAEQLSFILSGGLHALPFVRSWKPDAIIAFFGMPSGAITWLTRWIFGVPYIVSLRGGDVPGFRPYDFGTYHRLIGPFLRRIWRRAGAVVANSGGLLDLGVAFDPQMPIEIIPNGVDVDHFAPVERTWNPGRMLFVGRIVYQKGLDVLFQALGGLLDLEWQLTLVGDGNQRPHLEAQARALGMLDRIHFTGWLTGEAVVEQYQRANLYVAPSRHEGMPNVVLEAMASGLPVIASQIAGNEELVTPGFNGMLVPSGDAAALQSSLREMLTSPERQQSMGAASRQRVVASYTWDVTAQQYLEILKNLEAGKK
ncbi:MAG TPA: glycosyltransferase family 4 protein [Chloroflexi bacterium]|nr:glycosyltransferase family 4 protein [Chloroflexota bacterium]